MTLQTALNFRDNMTEKLQKMLDGIKLVGDGGREMASGVTESFQQAEAAAERYSGVLENFTDIDLSVIDPQQLTMLENAGEKILAMNRLYDSSRAKVEQMESEHQRLVSMYGTENDRVQKQENELLKAQLQLAKMGEANDKVFFGFEKNLTAAEELADKIRSASEAVETVPPVQNKISDAVEKTKGKEDEARNAQKNFNDQVEQGEKKARSLTDAVGGYVKAFLGVAAVKKGFEATIGAAGELQQSLTMIQGMMGNADVGSYYFKQLEEYAGRSGQKVEDLANVTQRFISTTKNTDSLMGLTQVAEKLMLKNTSQGMDGASRAIEQAFAGQFSGLQRTFMLSPSQLQPIKDAIAEGNMQGVLDAFNSSLATSGITDEVVDAYRKTAPQQFSTMINGFKEKLAMASAPALESVSALVGRINTWLQSDSATTFFTVIGNGVSMIVNGVTWIADMVQSNWGIVQPILIAAGVALAVMAAVSIGGAIASAAAWMLANWPLLLIIAIIALVVIGFVKFRDTAENVMGAIVGGVFWLGAVFQNTGLGIANGALAVAEFFANSFNTAVFKVQGFFNLLKTGVLTVVAGIVEGVEGMVNFVLGGLSDIINSAVSGINSFIGLLNHIPGVHIDTLGTVDLTVKSDWSAGIKDQIAAIQANAPTAPEKVQLERYQYTDLGDAYQRGFDVGHSAGEAIGNGLDAIAGKLTGVADMVKGGAGADLGTGFLDDFNQQNADNLGGIKNDTGNISKSVDISNEDLKYLRDIAERDVINKFTTQTAAPNLYVTFGDVRETADVDQIYGRLTEIVTDELAYMAEGVHP
ncbi:MAG: hypothetical protein FWF44_04485 [Defluviitaleaceae bacterium]|nr:hypothetical protein [Defluviitaleaceae bacterium]